MNLKESYRYANYLDGLLSTAYTYLRNKGFVTTVYKSTSPMGFMAVLMVLHYHKCEP